MFAVLDQGLISGSNFLLGIQLARRLHPASYGAYAVAFSVFSLLLVVDQSMVLEPMSVFGGSKYGGAVRRYVGQLLRYQVLLGSACLSLLLIATAGVYMVRQPGELTLALLGMGIATPSILLLYFTRRAVYLEYRSNAAAGGALLYCALLFSALWLLDQTGFLSPFTCFLDMGAAALATSLLLLIWIRPKLVRVHGEPEFRIAHEHWRYGRWALGSSVFAWISWNAWYTIVGSLSGLAGTGALKALMNLAMPVIQSCAALSLLVLPHTARIVQVEGVRGAKRQAILVGVLFAAAAAAYWLVVLAWHDPVIAFLYSGRYEEIAVCLPWLALASIASAGTVGPVSALRALEKPSAVCVAFFVSSLAGLAVGLPATRAYGVRGATAAILVSCVAALGIVVSMLARDSQSMRQSCAPEIPEAVLQ